MTLKISDRDVEKLLRQPDRSSAPPADLLARLRADLPAELPIAPLTGAPTSGEEGKVLRPARWNRPLLSLAATLAVLIGGSLIAYQTFRQSPRPESAGESAVMKSQDLQETILRDQAVAAPTPAAPAAPKEKTAPPPARQSAPTGGGGFAPLDEARAQEKPETKKDLLAPPPPVPPGEPEAAEDADGEHDRLSAGAAAKKAEEESLEAARPVEVPVLAESPAIEANSAFPAPQVVQRAPVDDVKGRRLETTSTQGDLRWIDAARAPAAAPPPRADEILLGAAAAGDAAWRSIERALAEGRWPNGEELEAARAEKLSPAAAARPGARATRQRAGAERNGDSWMRLREDILDFLSREEKGRSELTDLRRRTLRLLELEPGDERGPELLRILNLASGKLGV